ncbi:molybdopterin-dependent oxidoreductase [Desulfosarcina sp. OttesenSCG-928-G10]|nr:molybdopterin-dependent oxidoreductase [Desulfosarcina sp. OttesenSCG-928-G10]MDL2320912.1 molybdopterin-dependent oxidoreductase [Desulfosarcina sp. OttesenSCG-928-B08]
MQTDNAKKTYSGCVLCYHSCGVEVDVADGKVVGVQGQASHPLNKGYLCPKGRATIEHIYHPSRLRHPLKKDGTGFKEISWDQALDEIGDQLKTIKSKYGPEALGFFCGSVGVENFEMVALTHRFRAAYGSPNYFSVESICYRMRIRCRQMTFGKYPVEELNSNLYVLWGHNPNESDFPLRLAITQNLRKGAKLVVIDPKRIKLADKAEMYLKIRPGTDGALALAMIHVIITEGLQDQDFIDKWTIGFDKLVPHIQPYTPEWAEKITWVPADDIRKLARMFATTKGAAIYQGTCTQDQQANGTQTNRAISILQTIVGGINVPGGWVLSPRLALKNIFLPTASDEAPLGTDKYPLFYKLWGRTSPYGIVSMVPENIPDKLKGFLVLGGNPIVTMPDTNAFREAFKRLPLLVVYEQFMTDTAALAHYILPATSHLEGWSIAYNYNVCHCLPYLMIREQAIEPVGESRSVLDLYKGLCDRLNMSEVFPWPDEKELVKDLLQPCELNFEHLSQKKPEGDFYQEKEYETTSDMWRTPSGKIEIYCEALAEVGFDPLPTYLEPEKSPQGKKWAELGKKYPLILSTGQRDLFYTASQMHHIDDLHRRRPSAIAEMSSQTAKTYGITHGEEVYVETDRGQARMRAWVDDRVADGVVLVPHGWQGDGNCNQLTDCREESREPIMGYPTWKSQLCAVRPVAA